MRLSLVVAALISLAACAVGSQTTSYTVYSSDTFKLQTPQANGIIVPPTYKVEQVASDLNLPTHLAIGPEGAWYLTQLNGGENEGSGQVVRLQPGAAPQVILDKLYKPTGLAFSGNSLFVVSGNSVLVSRNTNGQYEAPVPLLKDLPFNGRSEGQIFTGPDGLLYFQSTGNESKIHESGFIYTVKPDGSEFKVFARGFKNAYAMAWDNTGKMYATEIGDGHIQGVGAFPEELNVIHRGGDYGWPLCYGNQQENHGAGGNRNICADTDSPLAMFPPGSTPTGLAVFDGKLIVALWNGTPPRLVSVHPGNGQVSEFASGFRRAIALTAPDSKQLLVVDMDAGAVYRITKQ